MDEMETETTTSTDASDKMFQLSSALWTNGVIEMVEQLFYDSRHADATIYCVSESESVEHFNVLRAHRVILAASSPLLCQLMTAEREDRCQCTTGMSGETSTRNDNEIQLIIPGTTHRAMTAILKFMYTGKLIIRLTEDDHEDSQAFLIEIMEAADTLEVCGFDCIRDRIGQICDGLLGKSGRKSPQDDCDEQSEPVSMSDGKSFMAKQLPYTDLGLLVAVASLQREANEADRGISTRHANIKKAYIDLLTSYRQKSDGQNFISQHDRRLFEAEDQTSSDDSGINPNNNDASMTTEEDEKNSPTSQDNSHSKEESEWEVSSTANDVPSNTATTGEVASDVPIDLSLRPAEPSTSAMGVTACGAANETGGTPPSFSNLKRETSEGEGTVDVDDSNAKRPLLADYAERVDGQTTDLTDSTAAFSRLLLASMSAVQHSAASTSCVDDRQDGGSGMIGIQDRDFSESSARSSEIPRLLAAQTTLDVVEQCQIAEPSSSSSASLTLSVCSSRTELRTPPVWKSRQPRMCQYCQRMFSNKFNLKHIFNQMQHILNMHTVGHEIKCQICNKSVKNKWYLRRHHVTHHGAPLKK